MDFDLDDLDVGDGIEVVSDVFEGLIEGKPGSWLALIVFLLIIGLIVAGVYFYM